MSNSIEDLLDSPEDNGDFDIGDEEEEALLDDNFDFTKTNKNAVNESAEEEAEEQDEHDFVLDLDNTTDFNEDENEENIRQDRFQSERPAQQVEVINEVSKPNRPDNRNMRTDFRGKRAQRGGFRSGYYHNIQKRIGFQNNAQNKRVLINPHFKGQVPIRNNISLVWDKNVTKKPALQVQPWAETIRLPPNSPWIRQPPVFQAPYQTQPQITAGIPVQQKIGIPSNIFIPPVIDPSVFQQADYMQPAQIAMPQYAGYNGIGPFTVQHYNVPQPIANRYNSPMTMCLNPAVTNYTSASSLQPVQQNYAQPRYNTPPATNNFQRTFTVKAEPGDGYAKNNHQRRNVCNMGPQARRRYMQNFEGRGPRSNLQEIKTSDNVYENQDVKKVIKIEKEAVEEDETMANYRQMIEHQKQLREKILLRKEERRKNAAKSLQSGGEDGKSVGPPEELFKTVDFVTVNVKAHTNLVVPSLTITKSTGLNGKMSVERASKSARELSADAVDKNAISSFLTNRKIIAKDDALPDTSVVVISNLATGSTEVKLRKLCKGVGDIKNLVMSPLERQATIQFKSVASAHAFYKKYQRFMLDLSMIQVTLKES